MTVKLSISATSKALCLHYRRFLNEIEVFGRGWLLICLCKAHRPGSLKGARTAPSDRSGFLSHRG